MRAGSETWVAGWGKSIDEKNLLLNMDATLVPIISQRDCTEITYYGVNAEHHICATVHSG